MSLLVRNAERILDTALAASGEDCDLMLAVDRVGAVRVVESRDWNLEGLRCDHGAESAYRVRREDGKVWIAGSCSGERCQLESSGKARLRAIEPSRLILIDRPVYSVERSLHGAGSPPQISFPASDKYL